MKKLIILLTFSTLSLTALAEESNWLDSISEFLGFSSQSQQAEQNPQSKELVTILSQTLNIEETQASGGLGAIFNYVKNNISSDQFQQLIKALPGTEELVANMPDLSQLKSSEGFGALLDKAAQYSDSLKGLNDVKKQFEVLGLKPEMITDFINQAQQYLDTEQGQEAKRLLMEGLQKM